MLTKWYLMLVNRVRLYKTILCLLDERSRADWRGLQAHPRPHYKRVASSMPRVVRFVMHRSLVQKYERAESFICAQLPIVWTKNKERREFFQYVRPCHFEIYRRIRLLTRRLDVFLTSHENKFHLNPLGHSCFLNLFRFKERDHILIDSLCGLVVRVPGYRSRGPGSILGATRLSEKWWVWNGVHSASWVQLRSYLKEKVAASV
jgi:hypothetical protein